MSEREVARERVLGDQDILRMIFRHLEPPSVKRVRLVSRSVSGDSVSPHTAITTDSGEAL